MIRCVWLGLLFTAGFTAAAQEQYSIVNRDQIEVSRLSPLGRQVVDQSDGHFASNEIMVVHAATIPEIVRILDEADYARVQMQKMFGEDFMAGADPFFVFSISSTNMWKQIIREHGLRQDGLAMRLQREIYFDNRAGQDVRPDRIMHEVVHMVIGESYPSVPYWLDEGLAGYLGWLFTSKYQAGHNVAIVRHFPALSENDLYSLEELLSLGEYPTKARRVAAFYRQSELLVQRLVEQKGVGVVKKFMQLMPTQHEDPVTAFRSVSGMDLEQEHAMFLAIRDTILAKDSTAK